MEISIVICSYNEGDELYATLKRLKRSIGKSIYNIEIIIIDSSNQNSYETYSNIEQVNYFWSNVRLFPGAARNKGVELSSAPIIAFTDVGFHFTDGWLDILVDPLVNDNQSSQVSFGIMTVYGENKFDRILASIIEPNNIKERKVVPNMAVKREIFEKIKFREDLRAVEDTIFLKELDQQYIPSTHVNAVNYYSGHPQSLYSVFKKWKNYSYYSYVAGFRRKLILSLFLFFLFFSLVFIFGAKGFLIILIIQSVRVFSSFNNRINLSLEEKLTGILITSSMDLGRLVGSIKGLIMYKKR